MSAKTNTPPPRAKRMSDVSIIEVKLTVGTLIISMVMVLLVIAFVVAGGHTFGQRCAKLHEQGTEDWHLCVRKLAEGGGDEQ